MSSPPLHMPEPSSSRKRPGEEVDSISQAEKFQRRMINAHDEPVVRNKHDGYSRTSFLPKGLWNMKLAHLHRPRLMTKFQKLLSENRFVLFDAPAKYGKLSLFQLYSEYLKDETIFSSVLFLGAQLDALESLRVQGLDLHNRKFTRFKGHFKEILIFIDGCHWKFGETQFWSDLCQATSSWSPENFKIVFSVDSSFSSFGSLPQQLQDLPKLTREDFLLDPKEFSALMDFSVKKRSKLDNPYYRNLIKLDCGHHILLTRLVVSEMIHDSEENQIRSLSQFCKLYYSLTCLPAMESCFGTLYGLPRRTEEFETTLGRLFLGENIMLNPTTDEDKRYLNHLLQVGILLSPDENNLCFRFSCPMAHRYFSHYLRIEHNRMTYKQLYKSIRFSLQVLDASSLDTDMEDPVLTYAFQYQILKAIVSGIENSAIVPQHMMPTTKELHCEPGRLMSSNSNSSITQLPEEMLIYLNGVQVWGVRVTLNKDLKKIGEMKKGPFGRNGPYSSLQVDDYVWLDLRTGPLNDAATQRRLPHQFTAYFTKDLNTGKCYWECMYGMERIPFRVPLLDLDTVDYWKYYYAERDEPGDDFVRH